MKKACKIFIENKVVDKLSNEDVNMGVGEIIDEPPSESGSTANPAHRNPPGIGEGHYVGDVDQPEDVDAGDYHGYGAYDRPPMMETIRKAFWAQ